MWRPRLVFLEAAFLALVLVMVGCGGGGSSSNPNPPVQAISVALAAQPPASLTTGATTSITANVSNDSAGGGVRWTVSCGSATCGSFNPAQTASGGATVFTAPAAVPSGNTVTVTATSVTDSTKTASATITITAPAQPIAVTLAAQPPMSLVAGTTASITANVANDSANAGVKWTVTCGGSPCGSFSPAQTASGAATTYTAPATVPTGNTVTVTATSVTDTTKTATAQITITAPVLPISVTLAAQPPSSLTVSGTTNLTANVANDTANAGVKWTATCGTSACGSFNLATTASGAVTIYMAPFAVPTGNTVTVTATSVTDSTKTATATITVAAPSGTPLANGTYVYHLAGQNPKGATFFAGAFTLANGTITAGEQDFTDQAGYSSDTIVSGSGISYASNGNVQLVLSLSNKNLGVGGVITLHGTKVSSQRVLLTGYDDFFAGTGSLDLQTSQAAPSGGYAFLIGGVGFNHTGGTPPTTIGGVLNFSGTTISLPNSVYDINFGQQILSAQAFTAGSVSAPDSLGRVTIGFTPNSSTGLTDFTLAGYIVSPTQIQLVEMNDHQNFDLAGMALAQGSNTGGFSAASLSGKTYTFGSSGVDNNGLAVNLAGTLAFGSNNGVSGSMAVNDLSAFGINTVTGGSYTVDATGRVTITNLTLSSIKNTLGFQAYLDGNGNALIMGADIAETTAGPAYLQSTTSPATAGTYGITSMGFGPGTNSSGGLIDANPWSAAGPVTVNSGSYMGWTDYNSVGTPTPNVILTGTTSTGTISLTGLNPASFTTANSFVSYPIDANRSVLMSIDPGVLSLGMIESVGP